MDKRRPPGLAGTSSIQKNERVRRDKRTTTPGSASTRSLVRATSGGLLLVEMVDARSPLSAQTECRASPSPGPEPASPPTPLTPASASYGAVAGDRTVGLNRTSRRLRLCVLRVCL